MVRSAPPARIRGKVFNRGNQEAKQGNGLNDFNLSDVLFGKQLVGSL